MKKIFLAGAFGKMGWAIQQQISTVDDLELVGLLAPNPQASELPVYSKLADIQTTADVWLDVTTPTAVFENAQFALAHGMDVVIGTSGLADEQVAILQAKATENEKHVLIVPNFSISAVLLMNFAEQAARYLPDAEVIEIHHQDKGDAPSGTAKATAQKINQGRQQQPNLVGIGQPARGENIDDVPVHALRLPGYLAHEEVLFGAPGETLHISQDSFTRESFMAGVTLALQKIDQINEPLAVGLDAVMV